MQRMYSHKLLNKKYNNWVKAQLALLFTKEGIKPFVCNEIQQFQLKCLDEICYQNGQLSGTLCSNCCTENVIKCPTNRICNAGRRNCSYHRNAATRYNPAGCPNKICHNFTTEIQNAHRYCGPSYKNTDATQWCTNSWEIAKCFMPRDGYKDIASAEETDFNGIISVIINYKDFQSKVHEKLHKKKNIFEQAREIGRIVRHSSELEVEDKDLQQYFKVLQQLLSDPVYLATDTHAQSAKQKLSNLENDTLVIGKDDVRKALDDVAKAVQDKIRTERDNQKKQSEKIKLEMIKRKQAELRTIALKTAEGVKTLGNITNDGVKKIKEESDNSVNNIESSINKGLNRIQQETGASVKTITGLVDEEAKKIKEESNNAGNVIKSSTNTELGRMKQETDSFHAEAKITLEVLVETLRIKSCIEQESITEQGKKEKTEMVELGETLQKRLNTSIIDDKEEQYITTRKKKEQDGVMDLETKKRKKKSGSRRKKKITLCKNNGGNCSRSLRGDDNAGHESNDNKKDNYASIATDEAKFQTVKDEIIKWYKRRMVSLQLSVTDDTIDTTFENLYVNQVVSERTKGNVEKIVSLEDLLASNGTVALEIFLCGIAGAGKTTFAKYLTTLWCQSHCPGTENNNLYKEEDLKALSDIDFVFLLNLTDSCNICNTEDMIYEQIIQNLPLKMSVEGQKNLLKGILYRKRCFLILDESDIWKHPKKECTMPLKTIPHRLASGNIILLTIARQRKLIEMKNSEIDKEIEISFLGEESKLQLQKNALQSINKKYANGEKSQQEFQIEISRHNLHGLESVPLILMHLVCLCRDGELKGMSKDQVYDSIIVMLLSRTMKYFQSSDLKQQQKSGFTAILEGLRNLASNSPRESETIAWSLVKKYLSEEQAKLCLLSGIFSESNDRLCSDENSLEIFFKFEIVREHFMQVRVWRKM